METNIDIRKVTDEEDIEKSADVIRRAFNTVAEEFGLTWEKSRYCNNR